MEERTFTTEHGKATRFMVGAAWVFVALGVVVLGLWLFFFLRGQEDRFASSLSITSFFLPGIMFVAVLFRCRLERRRLVVGAGEVKQYFGPRLLGEILLEDLAEVRTATRESRPNLLGWKSVTLVSRSGDRIFHLCKDPEAVKEALLEAGASSDVRTLVDPKPASGLQDPKPRGGTRVLAWLLAAGILFSLGMLLWAAVSSDWDRMKLLPVVWFLIPASILLFRIGETSLGYRKADWVIGSLFFLMGVLFLFRFAVFLTLDPCQRGIRYLSACPTRLEKARESFREAEQEGGASGACLLYGRGVLSILERDYPTAEERLQAALAADPDWNDARYQLSRACFCMDRKEEARVLLEEYLERGGGTYSGEARDALEERY